MGSLANTRNQRAPFSLLAMVSLPRPSAIVVTACSGRHCFARQSGRGKPYLSHLTPTSA